MAIWQKPWEEEKWKEQDKGLWLIGTLLKPRFHTVTTTSAMYRYDLLYTWVNFRGLLRALCKPNLRLPELGTIGATNSNQI
jgi:hypothetical protein